MEETVSLDTSAGRRHIIERPRLTRLLDETTAPVIMLVAPAGYGKTTLARQWLASRPHAWYEATASSADLAALGVGLAAAAESRVPGFGTRLREWLPTRSGSEGDAAVAADILASDIGSWPADAWLVIDDYHLLDSAAAEELVDRLVSSGRLRMLLTSRRRPTWATSRRLLYGELFEVTQELLRMDQTEADEVLSGSSDPSVHALTALADGWPAVIGLAAVAGLPPPPADGRLPSTLEDYIADELYAAMSPVAQEALCEVSLLPLITEDTAQELLGTEKAAALRSTIAPGVLGRGSSGEMLLNPLLRAFLKRRLVELGDSHLRSAVTRAVDVLIARSQWEEAFELIHTYSRLDLFDALLTRSLYELTNDGRVATLKSLVEFGRSSRLESPALDLADAELAFRQGFHERAKTMARQAALGLPEVSPLASRAFCRAGQSAYFNDEPAEALEDLDRAQQLAQSAQDLRSAVWASFIASVELGDTNAVSLLETVESIRPAAPEDLLRAQGGWLLLASRRGGLATALTDARSSIHLIQDTRDPVIRASFLHMYAAALRLSALYDDALRVVDTALAGVETFHLDFARPHLALTKSATAIAAGRFGEAAALLDQVETLSRDRNDAFLLMSALSWRCRLLTLEGAPEAAIQITAQPWVRLPGGGQYAEFLACRALAFARNQQIERALALINEAAGTSREVEATSLNRWARVLTTIWAQNERSVLGEEAQTLMGEALAHAVGCGVFDPMVFASQLEPLVFDGLQEAFIAEDVAEVRLLGQGVARQFFPPWWPVRRDTTGSLECLTPREREVSQLLVAGRSNKEIARTLYITESTAKVHVRSILKKLNARTRTEAVVILLKTPAPAAQVVQDVP